MKLSDTTNSSRRNLIIPALTGVYAALHDGAETLLRVVAGAALVTHGLGKIADPFGATEMVESLGFYPGIFWSPLLSFTEFFAGDHLTSTVRPLLDFGYGFCYYFTGSFVTNSARPFVCWVQLTLLL